MVCRFVGRRAPDDQRRRLRRGAPLQAEGAHEPARLRRQSHFYCATGRDDVTLLDIWPVRPPADWLAPKVAKWWLPDVVEFVDEIPKTSVGKFSKKDLRDRFSDRTVP